MHDVNQRHPQNHQNSPMQFQRNHTHVPKKRPITQYEIKPSQGNGASSAVQFQNEINTSAQSAPKLIQRDPLELTIKMHPVHMQYHINSLQTVPRKHKKTTKIPSLIRHPIMTSAKTTAENETAKGKLI